MYYETLSGIKKIILLLAAYNTHGLFVGNESSHYKKFDYNI